MTYYELLEVSELASTEVIKSAYKALAKKYHPDVNKDTFASIKMQQLIFAYEVLVDYNRRIDYDINLLNNRKNSTNDEIIRKEREKEVNENKAKEENEREREIKEREAKERDRRVKREGIEKEEKKLNFKIIVSLIAVCIIALTVYITFVVNKPVPYGSYGQISNCEILISQVTDIIPEYYGKDPNGLPTYKYCYVDIEIISATPDKPYLEFELIGSYENITPENFRDVLPKRLVFFVPYYLDVSSCKLQIKSDNIVKIFKLK